jgi:hypothetical protein
MSQSFAGYCETVETGTRLVLPYVPSSVGQFLSFMKNLVPVLKKKLGTLHTCCYLTVKSVLRKALFFH